MAAGRCVPLRAAGHLVNRAAGRFGPRVDRNFLLPDRVGNRLGGGHFGHRSTFGSLDSAANVRRLWRRPAMDSLRDFEFLLNDAGTSFLTFLQQGGSGPLFIIAAVTLAGVGLGLAAQAWAHGKSPGFSWSRLAAHLGSLVWLVPVAAVFAIYVSWMPSEKRAWRSVSPAQETQIDTAVNRAPDLPSGPVYFGPASSPNKPALNSENRFLATGTSLPDWVREKDSDLENGKLVVVTGEIGGTVDEARAEAQTAALRLVRDDFEATYPQAQGWTPPAPAAAQAAIRRIFVEEIDRKTVSSGVPFRVYRAYDQVELSPHVRAQLFPHWRDQIVDRRIEALSGLTALLTLTFATLAAYFRLDARTSGLYRRRLKFAAVCVIAAGGLAATTLL